LLSPAPARAGWSTSLPRDAYAREETESWLRLVYGWSVTPGVRIVSSSPACDSHVLACTRNSLWITCSLAGRPAWNGCMRACAGMFSIY